MTALSRHMVAVTDVDIQISDKALWFWDEPVGRWTVPFVITGRGGQLLKIDDGDRTKTASIDRAKPYHARLPSSDDGDSFPASATSSVSGTPSALSALVATPKQSLQRRQDDILGPRLNGSPGDEAIVASECVVKLRGANDPRVWQDDFEQAKQKKVKGLNYRNLWREVKQSKLSLDANIVEGHFIFSLTNYGTPSKTEKVGLVSHDYCNKDKPFMLHGTSSVRALSIRTILLVAACLGFWFFSHDVTQALLQSKQRMRREVTVELKPADKHIFGAKVEETLKLELPLHGVCDARDYWDNAVWEHKVNDLEMLPAPGNASLCIKRSISKNISSVHGVSRMYVNDSTNACNKRFVQLTETKI